MDSVLDLLDLNLRAFEEERHLLFAELAEELRDRPDLRKWEEDKLWLVKSAWDRKDIDGVLEHLLGDFWLCFLADNIAPLKIFGFYEDVLLRAYTHTRYNFSSWPLSVISLLFKLADRRRLVAAGDMWPHAGPYRVYRGVSGKGPKRRVRGWSWTLSFDKAKWFATRYNLAKPMVYEAEITERHVLAYYDKRDEKEFLCCIPKDLKLRRIWKA